MTQNIEKTKAELKDWVVNNCLMHRVDVDNLVNDMYEKIQEAESKLTFENAQADFLKADQLSKDAQNHRNICKELRDRLCPHAVMVPKEYYSSGTYYDAAYSEYWHECECCGMTTPRKTERHSWYG